MMLVQGRSRRHFTEAARIKALEVRRAKASQPKTISEVFITRDTGANRMFAWEIRRFGGVLLDRSTIGFFDANDARKAGEAMLAARRTIAGDAARQDPRQGFAVQYAWKDDRCPASSSTRTMANVDTRIVVDSI